MPPPKKNLQNIKINYYIFILFLLFNILPKNANSTTNFIPISSVNIRGDAALIGNASATCLGLNPEQISICSSAQNSTNFSGGEGSNNNTWQTGANPNRSWDYINIDPIAIEEGYRDSSMAELRIPSESTIVSAHLYWNILTDSTEDLTSFPARIRHDNDSSYTEVEFDFIDSFASPNTKFYSARADVTNLIRSSGSGNYYVAGLSESDGGYTGIRNSSDDGGPSAGWSLLVVFENENFPLRNINVYSGFQGVGWDVVQAISIPINGLFTPPSGIVNAKVGWIAIDGDREFPDGNLAFAPMPLNGVCSPEMPGWIAIPPNTMNPSNHTGNSTISYLGMLGGYDEGDINPNYNNTFGIDIDTFTANDFLGAGATNSINGACLRYSSNGENVFALSLFSVIDVFIPEFNNETIKTQTNLTHPALPEGIAYAGDEIEYTLNIINSGNDAATDVFLKDIIPTGSTYIPGSLEILSGANAGQKTDAAGDDQAEFMNNEIIFRLGESANATTGGTLGGEDATTNQSETKIRFKTRINNDSVGLINNTANIEYRGFTLRESYEISSNTVSLRIEENRTPVATTAVPVNSSMLLVFTSGILGLIAIRYRNSRYRIPDDKKADS